jgi:hypothetical protein
MMEILRVVRDLKLYDSWVGAGFIRNKVWDVRHGFERTELNDIDVLYYNLEKLTENEDLKMEQILNDHQSGIDWSVKNQARMHIQNNHFPYKNCEDAVAHWPETATAVAVRLNFNDSFELIAPYGLDDLFHLKLKRSPLSTDFLFQTRLKKKQWQKHWPQLVIEM